MGRQHTTWISEENWKKLQSIEGFSVSGRIGNAISMVDPDREMVMKAKMRQLERAKTALRRIHDLIHLNDDSALADIVDELEDVWWMVNE